MLNEYIYKQTVFLVIVILRKERKVSPLRTAGAGVGEGLLDAWISQSRPCQTEQAMSEQTSHINFSRREDIWSRYCSRII